MNIKNCHYFRMKVGSRNCYFHFELNGHNLLTKEEKKKLYEFEKSFEKGHNSELYIGYDRGTNEYKNGVSDTKFLDFSKDSQTFFDVKNDIKLEYVEYEKNEYYKPIERYHQDDLFWLALAYPYGIKTLVYGNFFLFCFKATGPMGKPKIDLSHLDNPSKDREFKEILKQNFKGSYDENRLLEGYKKSTFLPVTLEAKIERKFLPPFIDSLSVNQYFNQGTFRPLSALSPKLEEYISEIKLGEKLNRLIIEKKKNTNNNYYNAKISEKPESETTYSKVVRKILDHKFEFDRLDDKCKNEIKNIAYFLFSPAQLEAASAFFLMDIGYLPDGYRGGSLDNVDIRGRKRLSNFYDMDSAKDLRSKLEINDKKDVIELQCKNYIGDESVLADYRIAPATVSTEGSKQLGIKEIIDSMSSLQQEKGYNYLLLEWWNNQIELLV